jgi:chorismate mutase/prephenate dehydratase
LAYEINSATSIDALRAAIDSIDDQLIVLLNQRAKIAQEVGKKKMPNLADDQHGRVTAREAAILERLKSINYGPLPNDSVELIFDEIFKACLELQKL